MTNEQLIKKLNVLLMYEKEPNAKDVLREAITRLQPSEVDNGELIKELEDLLSDDFPNSHTDLRNGIRNCITALKGQGRGEWASTETMPEFDGEYICVVHEKEDCGAEYNRVRIVNVIMNKWQNTSGTILKWQPLPKI